MSGRVTVRVGQRVNASDVVATASVPTRHIPADVRRGLGMFRAGEAERAIVRMEGEKLQPGDVIAGKRAAFSRGSCAPLGDTIADASSPVAGSSWKPSPPPSNCAPASLA